MPPTISSASAILPFLGLSAVKPEKQRGGIEAVAADAGPQAGVLLDRERHDPGEDLRTPKARTSVS